MSAHLEFYFDCGSPFSDLADTQLEGLRARTGAALVYRPTLLGGVFGAPTFFVGDELFFGNDHLPFAERALSARR